MLDAGRNSPAWDCAASLPEIVQGRPELEAHVKSCAELIMSISRLALLCWPFSWEMRGMV